MRDQGSLVETDARPCPGDAIGIGGDGDGNGVSEEVP